MQLRQIARQYVSTHRDSGYSICAAAIRNGNVKIAENVASFYDLSDAEVLKIAKTALSSFRGLEEVVSYREQTAFRSPFLPKLKKPLVITKLESIEDLVRRLEKRIPKQIEESKSAILPIVRAAVLEIDRKARRA